MAVELRKGDAGEPISAGSASTAPASAGVAASARVSAAGGGRKGGVVSLTEASVAGARAALEGQLLQGKGIGFEPGRRKELPLHLLSDAAGFMAQFRILDRISGQAIAIDGAGGDPTENLLLSAEPSTRSEDTDDRGRRTGKVREAYKTTDAALWRFLLTGVQRKAAEKFQIVQTFGDTLVYFYGRSPMSLSVSFMLPNTVAAPLARHMTSVYDLQLRGSLLTARNQVAVLAWSDVAFFGYPLSLETVESSAPDSVAVVQGTMEFLVADAMWTGPAKQHG